MVVVYGFVFIICKNTELLGNNCTIVHYDCAIGLAKKKKASDLSRSEHGRMD